MDKGSSELKKAVFSRTSHARLNETNLVAHLFTGLLKGSVMIDVGAHFGRSAQPFADLGWKVICHETDPDNRK